MALVFVMVYSKLDSPQAYCLFCIQNIKNLKIRLNLQSYMPYFRRFKKSYSQYLSVMVCTTGRKTIVFIVGCVDAAAVVRLPVGGVVVPGGLLPRVVAVAS